MREDQIVYKILTRSEWEAACRDGAFEGSSDDRRDGFVHLSTAGQLAGTAARHFQGREGLVLVGFEAAALGAPLRWEPSRGGALFPHLFAPLPADKAVVVLDLPLGGDGVPAIPPGLAGGEDHR